MSLSLTLIFCSEYDFVIFCAAYVVVCNHRGMSLSRYRFLLFVILCAAFAVALFLPGMGGAFIFDDHANIVTNKAVHVETLSLDALRQAAYSFEPGGGSRALAMLSFSFDYWRGGLDPAVFRTTGLLIHALTMVVMAFLVRSLFVLLTWPARHATVAAVVLATLWAIHPLQVSSVLYVVQRMQTLCTLFTLLALVFYVRGRQAQIGGRQGRRDLLLTVFCSSLAFACKEDAVLLPAYALVLELTVLRFRAAQSVLTELWRKGYVVFVLAGGAVFMLYLVPNHWHWEAYPGRDFSTPERLLTQGRVLVMYLMQILLPLPQWFPFYYDDFPISRGLLQPLGTVPAWLMVAGLLLWGWRWRQRRPLFALGVLLFFTGHFITSNVIGLELAFEHRNHLPLIGVLLALADLLYAAGGQVRISFRLNARSVHVASVALVVALTGTLASLTWKRATIWGQPLEFARVGTEYAPGSARAWLLRCNTYFELSGSKPDSPWLEQAIRTCEKGVDVPYSAALLGNVVLFKAIQGTVTEDDWQRLLARLRNVPMSAENKRLGWGMVNNVMKGIPLDEAHARAALEIIASRARFRAHEYVSFGYFVLGHTSQPDDAYAYLERAVDVADPDDPTIPGMLADLEGGGYEEWAQTLRERALTQGKLKQPS
ncbi:MAG: hypothetical protein WCY08_01555 [Rhodocyclaceae bacterium]